LQQGLEIAGFFNGIDEHGAFAPVNGSFEGSFKSGSKLDRRNRLAYPPWFKVIDAYGNINASISGVGHISLPFPRNTLEAFTLAGLLNVPDMAGFGFCREMMGTACLSGDLVTQVRKGVGYFTDVYIRHPGQKIQKSAH